MRTCNWPFVERTRLEMGGEGDLTGFEPASFVPFGHDSFPIKIQTHLPLNAPTRAGDSRPRKPSCESCKHFAHAKWA